MAASHFWLLLVVCLTAVGQQSLAQLPSNADDANVVTQLNTIFALSLTCGATQGGIQVVCDAGTEFLIRLYVVPPTVHVCCSFLLRVIDQTANFPTDLTFQGIGYSGTTHGLQEL